MPLAPRTPVLVGAGQWSNRVDRGEPTVEPIEMMAEALRRAAADSGAAGGILAGADAVARRVDVLAPVPEHGPPRGRAHRRPPAATRPSARSGATSPRRS